ncbi:hypothetical protein ACFVP3_23425 [Streptomyces sp. NPDC057806]|uniref:hypothetical protein n=1 Tax=Streptomyces sp. NPDC057806 TaxID=3346255 RepID=UPI00369DA6E7
MQPAFTRGFRLHHNGQVLDGAKFPSGRTFVIDDPEYGLATVATSLEELLKGYHGGRVEWPDGGPEARRPRARWLVELQEHDGWIPATTPSVDRERVVEVLAHRRERTPGREFRMVRATTNYTVEEC